MRPGDHDIDAAVDDLARRLPDGLRPLARVAYNFRWSWTPDGDAVFGAIDADAWERRRSPVRLLSSSPTAVLERAAADAGLCARAADLAATIDADVGRPDSPLPLPGPVAFMCAEFGVHASLPVYSGGLGVLAGDIVKEASDLALPFVAVGLLYRTGYFHQRIDLSGMQHEYWVETDPAELACRSPTRT